jgi:hypothetical protein
MAPRNRVDLTSKSVAQLRRELLAESLAANPNTDPKIPRVARSLKESPFSRTHREQQSLKKKRLRMAEKAEVAKIRSRKMDAERGVSCLLG